MRVCVILNPKAGGERARIPAHDLKQLGEACEVRHTSGPGTARCLASDAVNQGFDTVVAAGGDGTINEVVNGIGDAECGYERTQLGVLPLGTVNVLARELGIPTTFADAARIVLRGRAISIDLPRMEFQQDGSIERRSFIQMAGAGWDARAIELVDLNLKKRIGQFAYMIAGLKALGETRPDILVRCNGQEITAQLVLVGNGKFYGGKIPIFSNAIRDDGLFDVRIFEKINWFVLIRYFMGFLSPRLYYPDNETYLQTESLRLESAERVPLELDGEYAGCLPAECSICHRTLRILVPS